MVDALWVGYEESGEIPNTILRVRKVFATEESAVKWKEERKPPQDFREIVLVEAVFQ